MAKARGLGRSDAADDPGEREPVCQRPGTRDDVWPARRVAQNTEPGDPERVRDGRNVGGPVVIASTRLEVRSAEPRPIDSDHPHTRARERLMTERPVEVRSRSRQAVEVEHRRAVRIAALHVGQLSPIHRANRRRLVGQFLVLRIFRRGPTD
jgi:hypothetical protein